MPLPPSTDRSPAAGAPGRRLRVAACAGAAVTLLLVGGAVVTLGWKASNSAMHPPRTSVGWSLADYPSLKPETVTVHSRTGIDLAGRFFRGRDDATVVLSHGYGSNQDEMLPVANALHTAGFNVFTYDMRGCGRSGGAVTLGALEEKDLRSVVDFLAARPDVDSNRIGALGFSMGAATTLMEAEHDNRIKAVVDDSGWADVHHWLKPRWQDAILRPTWRFSPVALELVELRTRISLTALRPVDAISHLGPRPVLIIHGADDEVVPLADSELNLAAARSPKALWVVQDAAHGDTVRPGGATTSARVTAFFDHGLRG
jgi:uncharacterized protein